MGYRIKERREELGLTQQGLADKSELSRGTICALENGSMRNTTTKTLMRIADALDTTVDQLFFTESV